MAESVVLTTQPRDAFGSRSARRLRKDGQVPAVVYGHQQATLAVVLPAEEIERAVRQGQRVVKLKLGAETETARIRELQWDHLGKDVLHVDFQRVSEDERIAVEVKIELRGTAVTGGVAMVEQPLHILKIECPANAIPESIRVPVDKLQLSQAIHGRELTLPPGGRALPDDDEAVVQMKAVMAEAEAASAAPGEPEVIGRKPEGEEETE